MRMLVSAWSGQVGRAIGGLAVGLVLVGCTTDAGGSAAPTTAATAAPAVTASPASSPVREGADDANPTAVSRQDAERIALETVGEGTVTWSGPEDDRGAAWEVEVTRPDGSEVDVLVAADGTVVKTVDKVGGAPPIAGAGSAPASGVISRAEAEAAAIAEVGEGRVTWVGREDERGAAWEVEITRPDGSEVDVLVAADGSIVR